VLAATLLAQSALAQEDNAPLNLDESKEHLALGMDVQRLQDDFGVGVTVSTPLVAPWFRFTLGGGVAWYPYALDAANHQTWELFGQSRFVVEVGPGFQKGIPVRPYGFGGASALFLPSSLSDKPVVFGGVGGFGFEFAFMRGMQSGPVTYYMEVGGCGYGGTANKLPTQPAIASGFLIGAGLRVYL
jgi:hypothetical protein